VPPPTSTPLTLVATLPYTLPAALSTYPLSQAPHPVARRERQAAAHAPTKGAPTPLWEIPQLTPLGGYISHEMRQRLSALSTRPALPPHPALPPRRAREETRSDAASTAADAADAADAATDADADAAPAVSAADSATATAPAAEPTAALAVSSSAPALPQRRKGKSLASKGGGALHLPHHHKILSFGELVQEAHAMQARLRAALAQVRSPNPNPNPNPNPTPNPNPNQSPNPNPNP